MEPHDPHSLLKEVLESYGGMDKWNNQPFEIVKRIPNTKVGDVGSDFVERMCGIHNFRCEFPLNEHGERSRTGPWDIRIEGVSFEMKTATEDVSGNFQFNHIRYHRKYDALICIGISPSDIYIGTWTKAEVTTEMAGNLVSMEKNANASYKLTKSVKNLHSIDQFENLVMGLVTNPSMPSTPKENSNCS